MIIYAQDDEGQTPFMLQVRATACAVIIGAPHASQPAACNDDAMQPANDVIAYIYRTTSRHEDRRSALRYRR